MSNHCDHHYCSNYTTSSNYCPHNYNNGSSYYMYAC